MIKHIILFLFTALLLSSCQDVIDIDLDEGEKRIIINGRVTDTLPAEVDIYATANYLSSEANPRIGDALVELFEDNVKVAELKENDTLAGNYISNFVGMEGKSYHIEVTIPEGHPYFSNTKWMSTPERMNRVPYSDSVYSKFVPKQPFIAEGYYAYIMFTEPAGMGDNYRQRLWKNDTLLDSQFDLTFFNDDFIDGFAFNDSIYPAVQVGDVSKIGDVHISELSSISAEGLRFLELLQQQTVQVGSTFDPPPAPIFGNIVNANDPNQLGLGYFFASKLSYTIIEIKE